MGLLDKISNTISASHKEAIRYVFEQIKKSVIKLTPRESEFEANRLIKTVSSKTSTVLDVKLASSGEKINSNHHNSNMEGAFIDLYTLYKEAAVLNGIQESHKTTLDSDYNKARAGILKLINDARVFSLRSNYPEFDDIKAIDFNIESNRTDKTPAAQVSPDTRLLKLSELGRNGRQLRRRNLKTTSTYAELISDGEMGQIGRQFPTSYAVDSKSETFWAEIIYKDTPATTSYTLHTSNTDSVSKIEVNGPIVKYRLQFSTAESVNQIKILPFSNFPVRVLEITYRSNSGSSIRRTIPGFVEDESLDWMEFNFNPIFATDIEIVFAQESYRNFSIKIPKNVLFATDFMLQLAETRGDEFSSGVPSLADILEDGNSVIYKSAIEDLTALAGNQELEKLPSTEIDLAGKTIMSIGETLTAFNPSLQGLLEDISSYTEVLPKELKEDIATITKIEYLIGAREIECNYVVYSPVGYYSSEKLEPKATVSNVRFESDEIHPKKSTAYGDIRETSIEWSVSFAEDRTIPVYPANQSVNGLHPIYGEYIKVDEETQIGLTRFPSKFSFATIRENSKLLVAGQDYNLTWDSNYDGKLQIAINGDTFDNRKLYTIDYYVKDDAIEIDVLSKFNDRGLAAPESFESTGPDNEISLKYSPFIRYDIVNSDDFSFKSDENSYVYTSPASVYSTGYAVIQPNWSTISGTIIGGITGTSIVSGLSGTGSSVDWTSLDSTYLTDPYRWYLKITDLPGAVYEVSSFNSSSGLNLIDIPQLYTGIIGKEIGTGYFSGNVTGDPNQPLTGVLTVPYSLEVVYKAGDQIFGFDNILYKPLTVLIGGTEAKNVTDYINLEQPAFTISDAEDGQYEYIHDGKTLYFNQAIKNTEVTVDYRWMTQYAKVHGTLRANKAVSPTVTPQVNEYRLFLNTTIL